MTNYLPSSNPPSAPGIRFEQPDQIVLLVRCTVCRRKAYVLMSSGNLYPWSGSNHERCGTFDLKAAKKRIWPAYRRWQRHRSHPEPAVKITPKPPHSV